jgi:hypothetical protein
MVLLKSIEKMRILRAILNCMQEEEKFDKHKNIVSASELLELSLNRYYIMQSILSPLKESLGKNIEITNLYFAKNFQDEASIVVEYQEDSITKFFTISQYDIDDIEVSFDLSGNNYGSLIRENKKKINMAFEEACHRNLDMEMRIPSTSKLFMIDETSNDVTIMDRKNDSLKLYFRLSNYERESKIFLPTMIECGNQIIFDSLKNDANLQDFLKNIKVYEENVPKYLKKIK